MRTRFAFVLVVSLIGALGLPSPSWALGTPALVKDVNPGGDRSFPSFLTNVDGTLFFTARNDTHGTELWKSDGTGAGTKLVKDIYVGQGDGGPLFLTKLGDTLFFAADDGISGYELWKSDGSDSGTDHVKDI
jgi:ELWxxDGT repeat protein